MMQLKLFFLVLMYINWLHAAIDIYQINEDTVHRIFTEFTSDAFILDLSNKNITSLEGLHLQDLTHCSILNCSNNAIESLEPVVQLARNAGPQVSNINLSNNNLKVVTAALLCQLHRSFPQLLALNLAGNHHLDEYPIKLFRNKYNHYRILLDDDFAADSNSNNDSEDELSSSFDFNESSEISNSSELLPENYSDRLGSDWSDDEPQIEYGSDSSGSSSGVYYDSEEASATNDSEVILH
jgi:Leucine-rich repeat (LRR) protein